MGNGCHVTSIYYDIQERTNLISQDNGLLLLLFINKLGHCTISGVLQVYVPALASSQQCVWVSCFCPELHA